MQNLTPPWQAVCILLSMCELTLTPKLKPWTESLTGTRGAYRPYNTTVPKIKAWDPKIAARS